MIRYLTAGESHGKGVVIIIDGIPSNLKITENYINNILSERQKGFGRGGRQKIEKDRAEIISGIRDGKTLGSPVSIFIKNIDFDNWKNIMNINKLEKDIPIRDIPRPGHADLSGGIKYHHKDFRNVLERASARETTARIIAGIFAKRFLEEFNIDILGYVINIGGIKVNHMEDDIYEIKKSIENVEKKHGASLRFPDINNARKIINKIKKAQRDGDTLGGIIRVITNKLPPGLGSFIQWDRKLDGRIAQSLISIQAFKGVEFGLGFLYASKEGSKVHDEIYYTKKSGFFRKTNNAGGFEGGMTNGEFLDIKAVVKPISTVKKGLMSVNVNTKKSVKSVYERSDVCAVPAASLIAENIVAFEIMKAFLEKFGSDEMSEIKTNYNNYIKYLKKY